MTKIKTEKHPISGMEILIGEKKVIFENGVVCSLSEYEPTTYMSPDEFDSWMSTYEHSPEHYQFDFRYAVSTGVLRRKPKYVPQTKVVPIEQEVNLPRGDEAEAFMEMQDEDNKEGGMPLGAWTVEQVKKPFVLSPVLIILYVMSIVGTMSAIMSAYHTTVANNLLGRPVAVGLITGTVMVLFSATAFTAARWFLSEKGAVRFFAALFAGLGIMVISYSMLSTLVVSYDAWSRTETEEKAELASDSEELVSFDYQVTLKQEELNELKESEDKLIEEAEYWKDKSWKRYDALEEQIVDIRKKITDARSELSSLISKRPQVASKAGEEKEDVFTFLSSFIKVNTRTLRLFMQAVPAMFFDVIAPFALSCAIYLAEKRRKQFECKEVESSELD